MTRRFAIILTVALLGGCSGKPGNSPVLARVGKTRITSEDFARKSADIPPEYKRNFDSPAGRKQFLQILIRERLIAAAAADSDVQRDPEYLRETARMKAELEARYNEFRDYLLTRMWLDELKSKSIISVTEQEIERYYKRYPREISISHIQLQDEEQAAALLKSLKAGASFEAAARARSTDPDTAASGGRMRPFIVGEFLPELETPAANMRNGEMQGVFKSPAGWHIIRKNFETRLSYKAAHDRIARIIEKKKLDDYLSSLQPKYPIEVLNDSYK